MSGYAKLFASIVESSLWDEDPGTCKVWITLLALADSEGFIRGSVGWLSKRCRVNVDIVDKALSKFQAPDQFSRTSAKEGRRIESTPDGWVIINYAYYRGQDGKELSKDARRTYQREWMRKKRAEDLSKNVNIELTGVNTCQPSASASASVQRGNGESEGKRGFKEPTMDEVKLLFAKSGGTDQQAETFWYFYDKKGWMVGKTKMQRVGSAVAGWINKEREQQAKDRQKHEPPTNCI